MNLPSNKIAYLLDKLTQTKDRLVHSMIVTSLSI